MDNVVALKAATVEKVAEILSQAALQSQAVLVLKANRINKGIHSDRAKEPARQVMLPKSPRDKTGA